MDAWKLKRLVIGLIIFLYSLLALSGCNGNGNNSSVPFSVLISGTMAQFFLPAAITTDGTFLYVADSGNNKIRKVDMVTGQVWDIAGSPIGESGSKDGTGPVALFYSPWGIMNDGAYLYVADTGNSLIRKVEIANGVVTTLAGASVQINYPQGIASDGTNFYVANTGSNTILMVEASGLVTTLAGTAGVTGTNDGTGSNAQFHAPEGLTTDGTYLYVTDTDNNTIRRVIIATGEVTTLAGTAGTTGSTDSTDGTGSTALFDTPSGVATDGTNLYVADTNNNTIRKVVIASGEVTTLAGTAGVSGINDGTGSQALFNHPFGITIDPDKTKLYVTDTNNNTIRKVFIASRVVATLAGIAPLGPGQSIALFRGQSIEVPAGTTIVSGGSTVTVNGEHNTVNTSAGAVVTVPAGATGNIDNTVVAY